MTTDDLKKLVKEIVAQANNFKNELISEDAPVNYACIFSQSDEEFNILLEVTKKLGGKVVIETQAGPVFQIEPLLTVAGDLQLLKIRKPDDKRPERGDADFTLSNYNKFKKAHLSKPGFKLIKRDTFEMIEAVSSDYNVLVYFSNPPLDKQLGIIK
jgi:hypothetical protein